MQSECESNLGLGHVFRPNWQPRESVLTLELSLPEEPQRFSMYYQRIPEDDFLEFDYAGGLVESGARRYTVKVFVLNKEFSF